MHPRSDDFVAELLREFPGFRLVNKRDSVLQKVIGLTLVLLTLGAQRVYMTRYHTVLGDTLYLPTSWDFASDAARYIILRHERVHLRQRRRLGTVWMALIYLFPVFPIGLALGRARLEWEAYEETLRATAEVHGVAAIRDPALQDYLVRQFSSGAYGWMWPFPRTIRGWIARTVATIEAEHEQARRAGASELSSPSS